MEDVDALKDLARQVRARRMSVDDALAHAFVRGLNAAIHAQQDREAHESGQFLAAFAARAV